MQVLPNCLGVTVKEQTSTNHSSTRWTYVKCCPDLDQVRQVKITSHTWQVLQLLKMHLEFILLLWSHTHITVTAQRWKQPSPHQQWYGIFEHACVNRHTKAYYVLLHGRVKTNEQTKQTGSESVCILCCY